MKEKENKRDFKFQDCLEYAKSMILNCWIEYIPKPPKVSKIRLWFWGRFRPHKYLAHLARIRAYEDQPCFYMPKWESKNELS